MTSKLRVLPLLLAGLLLAACSLPRGAALQSEVLKEQSADQPTFQVVAVTRANMPTVAKWPATGETAVTHWPGTSSGSSASIIRTGDVINVTIWDSQENSLLTNPNQKYTEIHGLEVDSQGSIFLPYINRVGVRGLTTSGARAKIQQQLEPIVPSAQVQVGLTQGRDHAVDVVAGVANPGAYPMPSRNYKVLNVIADAGGIPGSLRNPRVRLLRGNETYEISAKELFSSGARNALMMPRDTLIVEEDDRSFTALGASGVENMLYFPKDHLTAIEAMSLMGGISDSRADPEGVLILREYPARYIGKGPTHPQVVFTFDLTSADGLFAARKFAIHPGDTILATESPINNARTIFGLIGSVLGVSAQAGNLSN